jgi:undecaprenyl diphosphate synthase
MAVNYGGREEILHAVKLIGEDIKNGKLNPDELSEDDISKRIYTASQDEPDFIIRPSGEYRLSNFLVWQSAYAEFWFSDVLWPDFSTRDLDRAIDAFNKRDRRIGGIMVEKI